MVYHYQRLSNGMGSAESTRNFLFRHWKYFVFALMGFIFFANILQSSYDAFRSRIPQETFLGEEQQSVPAGFLVKTPGCRIPQMEAFDSTIKEFIFKEKQPVCNKKMPSLVNADATSIFIVNTSIPKYIQNGEDFHCCYKSFVRIQPKDGEADNKVKYSNQCVPFNQSAQIDDEFIKVECYSQNEMIYKDFFSFVPIKKGIEKTSKPLNVLIIGIDAVSRLNFHRQMPATVEYLQNLQAVELVGYNKVGDNTFPNLIPVLTGLSEYQLKNGCWPEEDAHFDQCPFIWKAYKEQGYVTAFGEDSAWMGIFNYMRYGFHKQPTDYMWGFFNRISEDVIGNSHNMNVMECVGARQVYKVFLNHIWNFVKKMGEEQLPYFAFYWGASLSHDYLNKPKLGDVDYYRLLHNLNVSGNLNRTALIVMSDHGIRWGDIRQTYQGRMEERLPFVFVVLPEWYKRQYALAYNNLLKNANRLTTPFDLHETLKDLLHPLDLDGEFLLGRYRQEEEAQRRGYSLFNLIPKERTCKDAHIASHWCTCQQSQEIDRNDTVVRASALFVVDYINGLLEGYAQCANLKLNNITNARVMTHSEEILNGHNVKDYMITLETMPGGGVFEVTVRYTPATAVNKTSSMQLTYQMEVMGTISRLNLYGKQSACITDFHLKLYCYCTGLF